METKYRHIVVFEPHDDSHTDLILSTLRRLAKETSYLLEARVEKSLDTRKGELIIANFLFRREEHYLTFKVSQAHQNVITILKDVCNWKVIDYFE